MDKVRIGIVGSKFAADFHCDAYSRKPEAEIVAVAAIDNLEKISQKWNIPDVYEDYREMFARDDIDLVSVCVPNFLHHDVTISAAEAGKHVLCEKPLAINSGQAREMIDACSSNGVKLFYGEDWCFAPALRRIRQLVDEGGIGKVLYVKAKETHNGTHSKFARNAETCGGGCLIHLGVHPVGWAVAFLSAEWSNPVVEVFGRFNSGGENNYVHKENTGEDWAVGLMRFANGEHAFIEGNYITVGGMDDKVEIYGTEGVIKVDLTFGSNVEVYSRRGYSYSMEKADTTKGWTRPAVDEFQGLGYVDELEYVVDCILNDRQPDFGVSGRLGLICNELITAMYRSGRKGGMVGMENGLL